MYLVWKKKKYTVGKQISTQMLNIAMNFKLLMNNAAEVVSGKCKYINIF